MRRFIDRAHAGQRLGEALQRYADGDTIVIALPRGGVTVGDEVAKALDAPLDVCVVRKVGVPWHQELGLGAVAEGGATYLTADVVEDVGISDKELASLVDAKRAEVEARVATFRGGRPRTDLSGRTVILVDDGIATGGTVRAAIRSVNAQHPRRVVLAVPVATPDAVEDLRGEVDEVVCLLAPPDLYAIGLWYEDFRQVSDDEVVRLLEAARRRSAELSAHH